MNQHVAPPVTAHAVLRYITRVLGDDLRAEVRQFGRGGSNWSIAAAATARLGLSIDDIQLTIAPPALWADIRSGLVKTIRHEGLTLVIEGGHVVTLHRMPKGRGGNKQRVLTAAEMRRKRGRDDRKLARRGG